MITGLAFRLRFHPEEVMSSLLTQLSSVSTFQPNALRRVSASARSSQTNLRPGSDTQHTQDGVHFLINQLRLVCNKGAAGFLLRSVFLITEIISSMNPTSPSAGAPRAESASPPAAFCRVIYGEFTFRRKISYVLLVNLLVQMLDTGWLVDMKC